MRRFALVVLLFAAGCYRDTLYVSGTMPIEGEHRSEWRHHAIFGLVSFSDDLDLRELCPQGIARIETRHDAVEVLVTILTVGLYSPTQVDVYCQAERPHRLASALAPVRVDAGVPASTDAGTGVMDTLIDGGASSR